MAVGIARMMRINLPVNFMSPYKSLNIAEFWRRWHMTLSRFLRDYVYIPCGGSRVGEWQRHRNLILTMCIGGIWHGAGWTFIIWGCLHGVYLSGNRAFEKLFGRVLNGKWLKLPAWALTFLCVVIGWVFFRAENLSAAFNMLKGMIGMSGVYLPSQFTTVSPLLQRFFGNLGSVPGLADGTVLGLIVMIIFLALSLFLCLCFKNLYETSLSRRLILASIVVPFLIQVVLFGRVPSEFIYFQF
jgi:D-alanyl-lipoteichoic acid acyltransferase DltB (MBOAT superfamily)